MVSKITEFKEINKETIKNLKNHLTIIFIENETIDNFFSNKHLVFTGTLSELSRDEAKYLAKTKGAKILSSISKKTDFLIAGEKAGSKIDKATQLGVKILNEKEIQKKNIISSNNDKSQENISSLNKLQDEVEKS